jgi:hypothetical protein
MALDRRPPGSGLRRRVSPRRRALEEGNKNPPPSKETRGGESCVAWRHSGEVQSATLRDWIVARPSAETSRRRTDVHSCVRFAEGKALDPCRPRRHARVTPREHN